MEDDPIVEEMDVFIVRPDNTHFYLLNDSSKAGLGPFIHKFAQEAVIKPKSNIMQIKYQYPPNTNSPFSDSFDTGYISTTQYRNIEPTDHRNCIGVIKDGCLFLLPIAIMEGSHLKNESNINKTTHKNEENKVERVMATKETIAMKKLRLRSYEHINNNINLENWQHLNIFYDMKDVSQFLLQFTSKLMSQSIGRFSMSPKLYLDTIIGKTYFQSHSCSDVIKFDHSNPTKIIKSFMAQIVVFSLEQLNRVLKISQYISSPEIILGDSILIGGYLIVRSEVLLNLMNVTCFQNNMDLVYISAARNVLLWALDNITTLNECAINKYLKINKDLLKLFLYQLAQQVKPNVWRFIKASNSQIETMHPNMFKNMNLTYQDIMNKSFTKLFIVDRIKFSSDIYDENT